MENENENTPAQTTLPDQGTPPVSSQPAPAQADVTAPLPSLDDEANAADRVFGAPKEGARPPKQDDNPPIAKENAASQNDDVAAGYTAHSDDHQTNADAEEADKIFGSGRQTATADQGDGTTALPKPEEKKKITAMSVILDAMHGIGEADTAIIGGILQAHDDMYSGADSLAKYIATKLPEGVPVGYDEKTGKFVNAGELKEFMDANPRDKRANHVDLPQSVTGNLIRGMAQFTAGFAVTGALGEAGGMAKATTKAGMIAKGLYKGFVSDFTVFEGNNKNLANLLSDHVALTKPVTDLLATVPGDNEALNRFKTALIGLGMGAGVEGLITAVGKGIRYIQQNGGSNAFAKMVARAMGGEAEAGSPVEPHEMLTLGDPDGPKLAKRELSPELQAKILAQDKKSVALKKAGKIFEGELATQGLKPQDLLGEANSDLGHLEINWAAHETSDDVKATMQEMANLEKKRIEDGKGNVVSWGETELGSESVDAFDVLAKRRDGQPLNNFEMRAAMKMWVTSGEKLTQMAELASKVPTDANKFLFEKMAAIHSMIQKEVMNASSELGRGLNILRKPVGSSAEVAKQLTEILDAIGGDSLTKANRIARLAKIGDQRAIEKFIEGTLGSKLKAAFDQAYMSALLGPPTAVVKAGSDIAHALGQVKDRYAAEYISQTLGTEGGVQVGEALAMMHGQITAFKKGLSALGMKFRSEPNIHPLEQGSPALMTRRSFEQTGEELMHGTSRKFESFDVNASDRYGGKRSNGGFYFTDNEATANHFANSSGFQQVSADQWIEAQGMDHKDPKALNMLRDSLDARIAKGKKLFSVQPDGALKEVDSASKISNDELWDGDVRLYAKDRAPRVIKAKVYGKTLDLTKPENVPADLQQILSKEGKFNPKENGLPNYSHEYSPALVKYARENGYGKIRVNDVYESGFKSTIALPEYIGTGRDVHKEFVQKAASEGRDIPSAVLQDYPDIKAQKPKGWGDADMSEAMKAVTPFEMPPTGKIAAANWNISQTGTVAKALNFADYATRANSRVISKVDEFSKMMAFQMHAEAAALRKSVGEFQGVNVKQEVLDARRASIMDNLKDHPDVVREATEGMKRSTFSGDVAPFLKTGGNWIQSIPLLGRVILPFKIIPSNIFTQTFEGTPLAPLIKSWRADVMAGGARADLAIARMSTGTAMLQLGMDFAFHGLTTGRGPQEPNERGNWENRGNQAYSIHIGEHKIAYSRLDPLGFTLGIGADIAEVIMNAEKHVDEKSFLKVMAGAIFSIANNVNAKSYMVGTTDLMNAMARPEGKGEAYLKHLMGSFVPSTVASLARNGVPGGRLDARTPAQMEKDGVLYRVMQGDPIARTADGLLDTLCRRVPGCSQGLPAQRNIWGEPMSWRSPAGWAYDVFSPYWLKSDVKSPIDEEFNATKYYPEMPEHKIHVGGKSLELNGKQYSEYTRLSGNGLKDPSRGGMGCKDYLNAVVTKKSPDYAQYKEAQLEDAQYGTDHARAFLKNTIESYRSQARAVIMSQDGELQTQFDEKNRKSPNHTPAHIMFPRVPSATLRGD